MRTVPVWPPRGPGMTCEHCGHPRKLQGECPRVLIYAMGGSLHPQCLVDEMWPTVVEERENDEYWDRQVRDLGVAVLTLVVLVAVAAAILKLS